MPMGKSSFFDVYKKTAYCFSFTLKNKIELYTSKNKSEKVTNNLTQIKNVKVFSFFPRGHKGLLSITCEKTCFLFSLFHSNSDVEKYWFSFKQIIQSLFL